MDLFESLNISAENNISAVITVQGKTDGTEVDVPIGLELFDIQDAVLFLRESVAKECGQRLWGLTFTLYPDRKFNIEHGYNKPEGYETYYASLSK